MKFLDLFKKGPKIALPKDIMLRVGLENKLNTKLIKLKKELNKKENFYRSPEMINSIDDTAYKTEIIERLLERGKVYTWKLSREIKRRYGSFDVENFESAARAINNYCKK